MGDERQGPQDEEEIPLSHYSCPSIVNAPSCIVLPPINANFEIKPNMLSILPTFHGMASERPYDHIIEFDAICSTMHLGGLTLEGLKLRLFPFSLKDQACTWFHKLKPRSILSWADMQRVFLNAYYPHHRTTYMRDRLTKFFQEDNETFYDALERFKDIELGCPHHGLTKWLLCESFYNGLIIDDRRRLDNASGGNFLKKGPNASWDTCEEVATQSGQWDNHQRRRGGRDDHTTSRGRDSQAYGTRGRVDMEPRGRGVYDVSHIDKDDGVMNSKLERLEAKIDKKFEMLLQAQKGSEFVEEQVRAINSYQRPPRNDPYSTTYNPGWRNHPNFSWRDSGGSSNAHQGGSHSYGGNQGPNSSSFGPHGHGNTQFGGQNHYGQQASSYNSQDQGPSFGATHAYGGAPHDTQGFGQSSHSFGGANPTQNAPPGFQNRQAPQREPKKSHMDDILAALAQSHTSLTQSQAKTDQTLNILAQGQSSLAQCVGKLEVQMGQLAKELGARPHGALPTQPNQNRRHEQAKAITTLRSGRVYDNKVRMPKSSNSPLNVHDDMYAPT
ncbi:uncharacterized protein LOC121051044 isoform X2 [Rosa chinensis]|uniref:uncharacterized protein LOC121051044 isoform X2 n=1 Tax=Rosa chinensis TaxID=74649 RepID=UPI001AD8AA4A|nr:uncharacterized protein LOC121051044 isoform X2 [Rosa chinensis]